MMLARQAIHVPKELLLDVFLCKFQNQIITLSKIDA